MTDGSTGLYALDGVAPETPEDGDFWIAPGARVMGRVRIGAGASVWFNAVIRGDNELIDVGAGSNVQDGAVMHTDPGFPLKIGADCTIGHQAILHGCEIGEGALIGMGATILNGAKIGAGCLVGANALVTEGKSFPDGSLIVGAPAKAARALDPQAIQALKASALHYRENMRRFRSGLSAL
ncbi:MAG: gamma carbonic anhydrase family protein [Pseudomonadota bacterium]